MGSIKSVRGKKDGSLRFRVDYQTRNVVTNRDEYTIPRMDKYIASFGEAASFSTIDESSKYWRVKIENEDQKWRPPPHTNVFITLFVWLLDWKCSEYVSVNDECRSFNGQMEVCITFY